MTLEPIGAELRRELGRLGPAGAIADVVAVWPTAVGAAIAANAWPGRIARDGTLHVTASSSAWAFELTHLAETIRSRLTEELGEAAPPRLRFATGPVPERGGEGVKGSARTVPEPSPAVREAAHEIAAAVADPELRKAVERAAAATLAGSEAARDGRPF